MSFSNAAETEILEYVFKGTPVSWAGNTNLYIALHVSDPGEAGSAISGEASYGSYSRAVLTRSSDISIVGNQVSNANLEQFVQCTSGLQTITHASIVDTASGAGTIIARALLNTAIPVSTGIQPQFAANGLSWIID